MKQGWLMKALPWLLIILGFYELNILPWQVALGCMLVGIVMIIERVWSEQWGEIRQEAK